MNFNYVRANMTRILLFLATLVCGLASAATTVPPSLINPAGSTAGQAIISNGPSTAPAWGTVSVTGATGTLPIAHGGTGATSASAALTSLGAAPLASPTFTGTPAAPTATAGTNTTQLATTAFVQSAISAGGVTRAHVLAVNSSGQSIPNNTNTVVTNWTEQADASGSFTPTTGVFTAPRAGYYLVTAAIGYVSSAFLAGQNVAVLVYKNGSGIVQASRTVEVNVTTPQNAPPIAILIPANAGDTIQVAAFQNSGSAVALSGSPTLIWMSISEQP